MWLFIRLDGRISRQVYWLALALLVCILLPVMAPIIDAETGQFSQPPNAVQTIILVTAYFSQLAIAVKRFHDLDMSGFFALGIVIPVIGILISIFLGIRRGDQGSNRFGEASNMVPDDDAPVPPNI